MLDFHGLITSYVAYFSTWQSHENRVFGTRFISLINRRDHSQNISDQRRSQEKKKKREEEPKQRGGARPRPGSAHCARSTPAVATSSDDDGGGRGVTRSSSEPPCFGAPERSEAAAGPGLA